MIWVSLGCLFLFFILHQGNNVWRRSSSSKSIIADGWKVFWNKIFCHGGRGQRVRNSWQILTDLRTPFVRRWLLTYYQSFIPICHSLGCIHLLFIGLLTIRISWMQKAKKHVVLGQSMEHSHLFHRDTLPLGLQKWTRQWWNHHHVPELLTGSYWCYCWMAQTVQRCWWRRISSWSHRSESISGDLDGFFWLINATC